MATVKVKTEDGVSTYRVFNQTRLVDSVEPNHISSNKTDGYIEVVYSQYKVIDVSNKVIPETIINRTYYIRDNADITAPDGSILLPSKKRYTNWCNHITSYPLQAFFRAAINDTLESYSDLQDNMVLPDYTEEEIDKALENWNNQQVK